MGATILKTAQQRLLKLQTYYASHCATSVCSRLSAGTALKSAAIILPAAVWANTPLLSKPHAVENVNSATNALSDEESIKEAL